MARLTLAEFLAQDAAREWKWGEHDCGLRIADWVANATGSADPAAHLRGRYASEEECAALYGGAAVIRHLRSICRAIGLHRTRTPQSGDIAAIAIERTAVGAIRVEGGWSVPGDPIGLTKLPDGAVRAIAAWSVPQCRS